MRVIQGKCETSDCAMRVYGGEPFVEDSPKTAAVATKSNGPGKNYGFDAGAS